MTNKNEKPTTTVTKPALVKAATFAAYLLVALPANMAMAANWQTPSQVAALATGTEAPQNSSITITTNAVNQDYYQVTYQDVAKEVARQLTEQAVEKKATATANPSNSPVLYSANHPLKIALHGLQIDPNTRSWQAQVYIISNNKTEVVKPVAGRYEGVVEVPVLSRQLRSTDKIEPGDLSTREVPTRQLRKDTITDAFQLVGKSPRGVISADRPIRSTEITSQIMIRRGDLVEMNYTTPYVHIKATGIALENGEEGGTVRVKNEKSEKAITARVVGAGQVEVNMESGS